MKTGTRVLSVILLCISPLLQAAHGADVKLEKIGATYALAQVASWLGPDRFAVGRWDGSITIFRPPISDKKEWGPVLIQALKSPSGQGIQMIGQLSKSAFVTSNDDASLALWVCKDGFYALEKAIPYGPKAGVANSVQVMRADRKLWLVTGHAEGCLLFWEVNGSELTLGNTVSIRSNNPIPSKYPLWNVRSVVRYKNGLVVTGSEDGDICLVNVPSGKVADRARYNPNAQRGINALSVCGDQVLLANCSVGRNDKNLWLYKIENEKVIPLSSVNLIKDNSRQQVFNFSALLVPAGQDVSFIASTEEGLLWRGQVSGGNLKIGGNEKTECEGGSALAYDPEGTKIVVVEHTVYLYKVSGN